MTTYTYNRRGNALAYNFVIEVGATLDLNFSYVSTDDTSLITEGTSARMSIKTHVGGTEIISLTTENSRITLEPSSGAIGIDLTATETESISAYENGVFDLELEDTSGEVVRLLKGKVTISPQVTS